MLRNNIHFGEFSPDTLSSLDRLILRVCDKVVDNIRYAVLKCLSMSQKNFCKKLLSDTRENIHEENEFTVYDFCFSYLTELLQNRGLSPEDYINLYFQKNNGRSWHNPEIQKQYPIAEQTFRDLVVHLKSHFELDIPTDDQLFPSQFDSFFSQFDSLEDMCEFCASKVTDKQMIHISKALDRLLTENPSSADILDSFILAELMPEIDARNWCTCFKIPFKEKYASYYQDQESV